MNMKLMRVCGFVALMLFVNIGFSVELFVENHSFELPGDGKHNMWDAGTNGKGTFTDVPGWTSDTDAADSGVETGQNATDGEYSGFLMRDDPQPWQMTSEVITAGKTYVLEADAWATGGADTVELSLFYDDGGTKVVLAAAEVAVSDSPAALGSVSYVVDAGPAEALGQTLGIMLSNVTEGDNSWAGVDNVRLSMLTVSPVNPQDGEPRAGINEDLIWTVVDDLDVDLYFGPENEPNLITNPAYKRLSQASATTWDPGTLAHSTTYYWRVDVYDPNEGGIGYEILAGPVWSFTTVGENPEILLDPVSQTVNGDGTVDAVLTVEAVNADGGYRWYKASDPSNELVAGAKYTIATGAGNASSTLTIHGVDVSDEDAYYCVAWKDDAGTELTDQSTLAFLVTERLVGWWKLNGDLTDSVTEEVAGATVHDGISVDPNYVVAGINGGALELYGDIDGLVEITDSSDFFDFYPRGYTVSAWVNMPAGTSGWGAYVSKQAQDPTRGFILTNNGTEAIHTLRQSFNDLYSGAVIVDDAWHLVTGTYDGVTKEGKVFVDGVLAAETTNSGNPEPSQAPLIFGAELLDGSVAYRGLLDDVRIWSYPLDPVTIAVLYTDFNPGASVCVENPEYDVAGPGGMGDEFRDCIVNLYDFVPFAQSWLDCNIVPDCIQ